MKRVICYMVEGKVYRVVEKEFFDEYLKWLKICWEDFVKVFCEFDLVVFERKWIYYLNKIFNVRDRKSVV